jgi:hypothetical protein
VRNGTDGNQPALVFSIHPYRLLPEALSASPFINRRHEHSYKSAFRASDAWTARGSIRDVVRPYGEAGLVRIADAAPEFESAVEQALAEKAAERLRKVDAFLSDTSWEGLECRLAGYGNEESKGERGVPRADKKIRVIKREERLRQQQTGEARAVEPAESRDEQTDVDEREVVPVIKGWIEELRRQKDRAWASIGGPWG